MYLDGFEVRQTSVRDIIFSLRVFLCLWSMFKRTRRVCLSRSTKSNDVMSTLWHTHYQHMCATMLFHCPLPSDPSPLHNIIIISFVCVSINSLLTSRLLLLLLF